MRRAAIGTVLACGALLAGLTPVAAAPLATPAFPGAVGGCGTLTGGTAPTDTDRDGMADTWERANGLDPGDASDGDDVDASGYSTVERYLNGLVP